MSSTYSPNLKIQLMATGENNTTWGDVTNLNLGTALEEAISGTENVDMTPVTVTLPLIETNSTQKARNMRLRLDGTPAGPATLIVPTIEKMYVISNATGVEVIVKTAAGTGQAIPIGRQSIVYVDGTSVVAAHNYTNTFQVGNAVPGGGLTSGDMLVSGKLGVGAAPAANVRVRISGNITGAPFAYATLADAVVQADVTSAAFGYVTGLSTVPALVLGTVQHFVANGTSLGAGSTLANQYGFLASSALTGGTANYGFYGDIPTAANNWNIFAPGTAPNLIAGSLGIGAGLIGIGTAALKGHNLRVQKPLTGDPTVVGVSVEGVVQSDVTTLASAFQSTMATAAGVVLPNYYHFRASQGVVDPGSTITNQTGFLSGGQLISATNNYGFRSGNTAGITAGKVHYGFYTDAVAATGGGTNFAFYAAGTAPSVFGPVSTANLTVNTAVDNDGIDINFSGGLSGVTGPAIDFNEIDGSTTLVPGGRIKSVCVNATAGSSTMDMTFWGRSAGVFAERMRLSGGGGLSVTSSVTSPVHVVDAGAYFGVSGGAPVLSFDTNDYIVYDRPNDAYLFRIGGVEQFKVTPTITATGGDLYPGNLAGFYLSAAGGSPLINFDANDYLQYDRAGNAFNFLIGSAIKLAVGGGGVTVLGNANVSGALGVSGALTVGGTIGTSVGGVGNAVLNYGTPTETGYLAFHRADNTRVGYVGFSTSPSGPIKYSNDLGGGHNFSGGSATFSDNLTVAGNISTVNGITGGGVTSTGAMAVGANLNVGGSIVAGGDVYLNTNAKALFFRDTGGGNPNFICQGDNNFVFYGTDAGGGLRPIFGVGMRSSTSSFGITVSTTIAGSLNVANDVVVGGNVTAFSDAKLKTNLEVIPDALDKLCSLNGYTYERVDQEDKTRQAGLIAQEVQKVLPEVVSECDGTLSLAYGNMVALLVEAVKELRAEVASLKEQIK